ncbi:MAG: glycosyltransferase family 4 protein [Methylobacteriaceae bacterium]|nr:glycosyltransferase family 4 protein [Methylobacteriaceae bacterium]
MDGEKDRDAADKDRIRILEFQVDQLRGELERLKARHEEAIYSVAWHLAWPARFVERAIRRAFGDRNREADGSPATEPAPAVPPLPRPSAASILPLQTGPRSGAPRRLLVDVTAIVAHDDRTGIQRVVRNVVAALYREPDLGGVAPLAVRLEAGRLVSCETYLAGLTGAPQAGADAQVEMEPGDRLLMLDNSWKDFERFHGVFAQVRSTGGEIISCVYDLIPQLYKGASVGRVPEIHLAWLKAALIESDGMIAISRTVAEELCAFVADRRLPHRPGLKIGWFHCGSDIAPVGAGAVSEGMKAAFTKAPTFLLVGTLEPRKGHAVALGAFERLWRAGCDYRLVFVGRRGWHVDALIEDMRANPEFGRRIHWFENADDADLAFAYDHCTAVLAPSYAEGFGLPLAEAAWRGRPTICSDIPVFREIGGGGALYFRVNDAEAMADALRDFVEGRASADPSKVVRPTWREAALRIVDVVMRGQWMRTLA